MATKKTFIAKNGLDASSNKIVNVSDPTSAQDAATKAYVDSRPGGLSLQSTNANGMVYLNGSSQATTTSNLQYTGSNFFVNASSTTLGAAGRTCLVAAGSTDSLLELRASSTSSYVFADTTTLRLWGPQSGTTWFGFGSNSIPSLSVSASGLDCNSLKIANVATPTAATDAANKAYVDNSSEYVSTQSINLLNGENSANWLDLNNTYFGKILRITTTETTGYGVIVLPNVSGASNTTKGNITILNNTGKAWGIRVLPKSGEYISDRGNVFFPNGIVIVDRRGAVTFRVMDGKWQLINEDDIVSVQRTISGHVYTACTVSSDGTIPLFGKRGIITLTTARTAVGRYTLTFTSGLWAGHPQIAFTALQGTPGRLFSYTDADDFLGTGNFYTYVRVTDTAGNDVDADFTFIMSYPTNNMP